MNLLITIEGRAKFQFHHEENIKAAINVGVKSIPPLFINGRGLRGVSKPWMLNEILQYGKKNLVPTR